MATPNKVRDIEAEFVIAFGKGLQPGADELWARIFREVPDDVLERASRWLLENRKRTGLVAPGEMTEAVRAVGGGLRTHRPHAVERREEGDWVPIKSLRPELRTKKEAT